MEGGGPSSREQLLAAQEKELLAAKKLKDTGIDDAEEYKDNKKEIKKRYKEALDALLVYEVGEPWSARIRRAL